MSIVQELKECAQYHNLEVIEKPNGHFQIKGSLLVNYYPLSKNRTAYVGQTNRSKKHVLPEDAVKMALNPPEITDLKSRRGLPSKYKKWKIQLIKKSDKCHWCRKTLTLETATIEHIVPLARGGLDNKNNVTLACEKCNQDRGCDMPEIMSK